MDTYIVYPTKEQEKAIEAFLEALEVPYDKRLDSVELPEHVLKGIAKGQADFEAGRFITFEEFRKKFPVR
jgi:hypothetical protein